MPRLAFPLIVAASLATVPLAAQTTNPSSDEEIALEEFITRESARADAGDLVPTSRPTLSVFGEQSALEVPRSLLVFTRELMDTAQVEDFSDLNKIGAGTQQINYYGVPGAPILRGAKGGVFFNGMQRAYQRNEMPLSFGSLDAMDVVKGPAPAHYGPSQAGGYVAMIPKSPFFDRRRGSLQVSASDTGLVRAQLDQGGPFLAGGERPAAYRLSLTGQAGDSWYDGVRNDFASLYASLKIRLAPEVSLFTGGEYYDFRSNENAGWNRVTQALIDRGEYIVGEPISIVSAAWGGVANRDLLGRSNALVVPAAVVDAGVSSGFISGAQRDAMRDLADAAERAQAYAVFSGAELEDITQTTSGYQYTPEYFAAGGRVFTAKVDGSTVLRDPRDHADSRNLLWFADLEDRRSAETTRRLQFMVDALETDKLSSYGYAMQTEQVVLELKGTLERRFDLLEGMRVNGGASVRYTDAMVLQDYSVEPFSRRDITTASVSANTLVLSGPQRGPDGLNFWSPTPQGGANAHSQLWQLSAFAYAINQLTPRLATTTSLLGAWAPYSTRYPSGVDRVPADSPLRDEVSGDKEYFSASFSPVLSLTDEVRLYATWQYGTAIDPHQGGAVTGRDNFTRNQLLEAGAKASLLDARLFAVACVYGWEQERFDTRQAVAEPLEGDGWELEFTWAAGRGLTFIGSLGEQHMRRDANLTPFRAMPLTDEQYALHGGVMNTGFGPAYFNPGEGRRPAANPDLDYPGFPERQVKLLAVWRHEGGLGLSGGPIWSSEAWHNFDHTLRLPSSLVWNVAISWRAARWSAELSCENLTDEDYFLGFEPVFGANTLLTKAPGRVARLTVKFQF
ncbi:MAG: hypothetical protein IAE82_13035 [Opitutaceae bacterium]|nr:hypothetical protein [Opitutaceae bacterium]